MDVDLLRPGTVPISPDTVLWFEFLLDKELLLKHLQKPAADPSPVELINKFTIAVFETFKNEVKRPDVEGCETNVTNEASHEQSNKYMKKTIALKILALKVAAYIKWDIIELMSLPFKIQVSILQDLLYLTNKCTFIEIPNVETYNLSVISKEFTFALLMYHRWLLNICMRRIFCQVPTRMNGEMTLMEESYFCSEENIDKSVVFLSNALTWKEIPLMLSFDCFVMLTEDDQEVEHDWSRGQYISRNEFSAQINYELGCFYFYRENYDLAKTHFKNAVEFHSQIIEKVGFCNLNIETLDGYFSACKTHIDDNHRNLLHAFSVCVANQYMGILNVFIEDNKYREIPLNHRINLELDIVAAQSSGKFAVARDLLPKIQALNAIRCVLEQKGTHNYSFVSEKHQDYLIWAALAVWDHVSVYDKKLLSSYFLQLVIGNKIPDLLKKAAAHEKLQHIVNDDIIAAFNEKSTSDVVIPPILENSNWDFPEFNTRRNPKLEIRTLEHQLIINYDPSQLRDLLVKVTMKNSNRAIWKINPKWELPIPLQSVIVSFPRGFLQDYGFVLLAKAKEMAVAKDWTTSLVLLRALEAEIKLANPDLPHISKLAKLVGWEILLVEVTQLLEECPAPPIDKQILANSCKACLETNDSVLPRTEVTEQCVLCLLNLGYWDFFVSLDKRFVYFELGKAIAIACQDLNKSKGSKKFAKDLWDLTLPAFIMPPSQSKKGNSGGSIVLHRETPVNNTKTVILSFFSRLRDCNALRVVISLLTKLYNVLKDEASLELNVEYGNLWPAVISNANSYNIEAVSEILLQIVDQALKFYPYNVPWLRLIGDINFVEEKYENALNYYLKSLIICNEYFNIPIRQDDHIYRRMIKSCASLGCYTQAAVLCQFLDEPDYASAFRYLSEQKSCNDAVDAYYNYFWDTNILEYLIHVHHKKGEFQRRKKAVEVMGLLELNANNNEEIVREASNHRKSTFLRALCKQFVY